MKQPNYSIKRITINKYTRFSLLQFSPSFESLNRTMILQGVSRSVESININVAVKLCWTGILTYFPFE